MEKAFNDSFQLTKEQLEKDGFNSVEGDLVFRLASMMEFKGWVLIALLNTIN